MSKVHKVVCKPLGYTRAARPRRDSRKNAARTLLCGLAGLLFSLASVAETNPIWVVTYIEVAADSKVDAAALISTHIARSRTEEDNLRFKGLQRVGRDNHFAILEVWADADARAAHAAAAHTREFRESLQPMLYSPYDERLHSGLEATLPEQNANGSGDAIYVLTHADIVPPEQFAPCGRRPDPAGPCGNDLLINLATTSREHGGNLRFDILTQISRPNHMTVVEVWESTDVQKVHEAHPDRKAFRDEIAGIDAGSGVNADPQFVPDMLLGSLWDERLYRPID